MITWTDLAPYVDPNGMIADRPNPTESTGNALLRTAQAMKLLYYAYGSRVQQELYALGAAMVGCEGPEQGLFCRTPPGCGYRANQESQDDYIGVGVLASLLNPTIAQEVLKYGRKRFFHYGPFAFPYYYRTDGQPDTTQNPAAWLGRFGSLITHLEWAAGEKPNWFRRLWWAYDVAFCADTQDGWALTDLMVLVADRAYRTGWLESTAIRKRASRLAKLHPEGMSGILLAYFNYQHPIATHYDDKEAD